jgi:hypothetical protein
MINTKHRKVGYYYDKLKSLLLVLLMVLCIVQVGILWSTQSGSFHFLSSLFSDSKSTSQVTVEDAKGNYLLPFRIVLSTGFDKEHLVIPNGTKEYSYIWDSVKTYLSKAVATRPQKVRTFSEKEWGRIAASKPYLLEFKTPVPIDIINWVLNIKSSGGSLTSIYKIILCPDDPDNNYSDTLYIRDDKNIYTFSLSNSAVGTLRKDEFESIYAKLSENPDSKKYQMTIETWEDVNISLDMLGPIIENTTETYPNLTCTAFPGIDANKLDIYDYEKIGKDLFGESINNFDYDRDINGSAVFKKADSVYRLYKNSVLEYKFTGTLMSVDSLNLLESYKKAVQFIIDINRQNSLLSGISVYLSGIEQKSNSYVFKFDYGIVVNSEYGEVPVILKDYAISKGNNLDSCISIEANSKRVTQCQMIPLKFKPGKMANYEWAFQYMNSKTYETYPELNEKDLSVEDFGIYYVVSNTTMEEHITPSFVLYTKYGSYAVPLREN